MSFMNKVGSMLNKKVGSMGNKKGDANTYKPAGVHVLGEDYFPQDNLMLTEDSLGSQNGNLEKRDSITGSASSKALPSVSIKRAVTSSMKEILGVSKQVPQKNKQKLEDSDFMKGFTLINGEKIIHNDKKAIQNIVNGYTITLKYDRNIKLSYKEFEKYKDIINKK